MAARRNSVRWTRRFTDGVQELGRTPFRFAFHLAVARLLMQWRSLLTIVAGAILAASIGALVPLYTTAIAQVGMTQRLDEEPAHDVHVTGSISLRASTEWADGAGLQDKSFASTQQVYNLADQDLGVIDHWVDEIIVYNETEAMGLSLVVEGSDELQPLIGMRARLAYYADWPQRVSVVNGRLPLDIPEQDGVDLEMVIGLAVANEINLDVGTILVMDQRMNASGETGSGHPSSQPVTAQIVGIVSPLDEDNAYWLEPSPLRLLDKQSGAGLWDYEFVALSTSDRVTDVAINSIPDTPTRIGWRVLFAHDNLPFSEVDTARDALGRFERNMRSTFVLEDTTTSADTQSSAPDLAFNYHTRLIDYDTIRRDRDDGILLDYTKEVELLDAPFGLLLLQVGALVLFYLMVTAALVRRGERREIAMLQSRGAWDSQIMLLRGIEALLICVIAVLIAPVLSKLLLTALGPSVANTEEFPLPLTREPFLYAAIASAVTFLTLMGTLRPVLRLPLVLAGGAASRSEKQHWWQRFYLDVVLALVGVGALWLLVRRGSPLSDVNLGGKQADPLMLMAPALLFLALGSMALRFFPIFAALAARITSARRGLLGALASWQLSREPVHYGRITFLLALAIGIGWFATSFRATVSNSHQDQARYLVGTDARFVERDTRLNVNRARTPDYYMADGDVSAASTAYRIYNANLSTSLTGDLRGTILAIDPDTFGSTLYWRSDLGAIYTPRAPGDPPALPVPGEALPFVPDKIGVWVRFQFATFQGGEQAYRESVGRLTQRTEIGLRLLDAEGAWITVPVAPVEVEYLRAGTDSPGTSARAYLASGWVYCEADLAALEYIPQGPVNLVSFYVEYRAPGAQGERGMRLTLADMMLIDADGAATPHRVFADGAWEFKYDRGATATGDVTPGWNLPGEPQDSIYISWEQDAQRTIIGALLNYPELGPMDAVVSRRVQEDNGLTWGLEASPFTLIGIRGTSLQFQAVQVTEYFPSLFNRVPDDATPKGDSFIVIDARELMYRLNRRPSATYYPDEVWLKFGNGVDERSEDAVRDFLREQSSAESGGGVVILSDVTLAEELGRLRTNPLGLGLLGLMYLAFIMALALSVVGMLTYAGLTAQARRTEFGVLRALGQSSLRVVGMLALEQLFVMAIGVTLGAGLGWVLSSQVVPTLALGATGENVIPPFVMRVEMRRIIEYGLMMVVVLGLVLSSSLLLVRQLSLARTLRLGEE
ncbi:MAG: FtsX-like permease family protein [Anaerolineae bacterium]|nr:FtsX-like permease family protein [Anaerolineae bacterium]